MGTTYEPCENDDCAEMLRAHPFPTPDTRVSVTEQYPTRVPGTEDQVLVKAGQEGVVVDYVAEWHDVNVRLSGGENDGVHVWLDPEVLDWDITVTIGWTRSDPDTGYSSFTDGYRPGAAQHRLTVHVSVPDDADVAAAVEAIAEAAFTATNHPAPETLTGYARQIYDGITASGYHGREAHYSLSVGDTVTVGEVTLACAPTGWQRVTYAGLPTST